MGSQIRMVEESKMSSYRLKKKRIKEDWGHEKESDIIKKVHIYGEGGLKGVQEKKETLEHIFVHFIPSAAFILYT